MGVGGERGGGLRFLYEQGSRREPRAVAGRLRGPGSPWAVRGPGYWVNSAPAVTLSRRWTPLAMWGACPSCRETEWRTPSSASTRAPARSSVMTGMAATQKASTPCLCCFSDPRDSPPCRHTHGGQGSHGTEEGALRELLCTRPASSWAVAVTGPPVHCPPIRSCPGVRPSSPSPPHTKRRNGGCPGRAPRGGLAWVGLTEAALWYLGEFPGKPPGTLRMTWSQGLQHLQRPSAPVSWDTTRKHVSCRVSPAK